jgi:hypothetical protein
MNLRETEEYKNMTPYRACSCTEGFNDEEASEAEILAAWQYISDTYLWRNLQGFYGRTVMTLLDEGIIDFPIPNGRV